MPTSSTTDGPLRPALLVERSTYSHWRPHIATAGGARSNCVACASNASTRRVVVGLEHDDAVVIALHGWRDDCFVFEHPSATQNAAREQAWFLQHRMGDGESWRGRSIMSELRVRDIMTRDVKTIGRNDSLATADEIMRL